MSQSVIELFDPCHRLRLVGKCFCVVFGIHEMEKKEIEGREIEKSE